MKPAKASAKTKEVDQPPTEARVPADDTTKEIYRYVAEHYGRTLGNRESLMARFQRVQGVAGLMVPCIAFCMPILSSLIADATSTPRRIAAGLVVVVLAIAAWFVIRAVLSVPGVVGNVAGAIPGLPPDVDALIQAKTLNGNTVLAELTGNYIKASKQVDDACELAKKDLVRAGLHLKKGVVWTIVFVVLTVLLSVIFRWRIL